MKYSIDKTIQLRPEEEVLEIVHEDIVPHLLRYSLLFLWFVAPFFFLFPLFQEGVVGVFIFFALVASACFFGLRSYVKWANTTFILTDHRVIDVDRKGFFDRVVSEIPYHQIGDVTYRVKGIVPTMFRYGDVRVHVTGSGADIEFRHVARPSRIHDLINDLRETVRTSPADRKEHKLRTLAKGMSMDEIEKIAAEMRRKEREEAVETLYKNDDA